MTGKRLRFRNLLFIVLIFAVAGAGIAAFKFDLFGSAKKNGGPEAGVVPKRLKVDLIGPQTISVPPEVLSSLGIRKGGKDKESIVATAQEPKGKRPLELSGSTMFEPGTTYRIRARFAPADVVAIAMPTDKDGHTTIKPPQQASALRNFERQIRPGDFVKANEPLGVFYSTDVGSKKNDLIDALVQYKLDYQLYEKARLNTAISEVLRLTYERNVQSDQNAINRALGFLETWKIAQEDIDEIYAEAEESFKLRRLGADLRPRKFDPNKDDKWGKVIVRSPADGFIVEQNVSEKETINDNTVILFQIAKADRLQVMVNAPEETIKDMYEVYGKSRLEWTIRTLGDPNGEGEKGPVETIGMLVDQNQHTVPLKGFIENKNHYLRAGQLVTATIMLPAPKDAVEIPAAAVADDGKQAIVFVQPDPAKSEFVMRRVVIVGRTEDRVCVRSKLSDNERLTPEDREQGLLPRSELKLGDRVIMSGLLELKKELEDLESES